MTRAKVEALEKRMDDIVENAKDIAALAARVDSAHSRIKSLEGRKANGVTPATLWNSTNGKFLIVGGVIVLLALVGWNAEDIGAILSRAFTPGQ